MHMDCVWLYLFLTLFMQDTGLTSCIGQDNALPAQSCQLPPYLSSTPSSFPYGQLACPGVLLNSFSTQSEALPPSLVDILTSPFPPSVPPGSVIGGPGYSQYYGCSCLSSASYMAFSPNGSFVSCIMVPSGGQDSSKYELALILVAILPITTIALGTFIFIKYVRTPSNLKFSSVCV